MQQNKKAQLDIAILILFVVILLAIFYTGTIKSETEFGDIQNNLLVSYIGAEKARDYLELSATQAAYLAAKELEVETGTTCFSSMSQSEFKSLFTDTFNDLKSDLTDTKELDYSFTISKTNSEITITGDSSNNLAFKGESFSPEISYTYKPIADFEISFTCTDFENRFLEES